MKTIKNNIKTIILISVIPILLTGCTSNVTENNEESIAKLEETISKHEENSITNEDKIDNTIKYFEIGENKTIPIMKKENIKITDVIVESAYSYVPNSTLDRKNIKIQFVNNSNIKLDSVDFKYKFGYYDTGMFMTFSISPNDTAVATSTTYSSVPDAFKNINNVEDYLTNLQYSITEGNMKISFDYDYKTNIYRITTRETTDKVYTKIYFYYPVEDKLVPGHEFVDEISDIDDTSSESSKENTTEEIKTNSTKKLNIYSVEYGKLLDVYQDEGLVIIKTKIDYAYSKKSTINQNGFNLEHIIEDNDMENIDEIQYWAVADMGNGYDEKVVSFTMDKNLINKVKNGSVAGAYIINEASDVWIHTSLR